MILKEYFMEKNHNKYDNDSVIIKWQNDCNKLEDNKDIENKNEKYLQKCPICRS